MRIKRIIKCVCNRIKKLWLLWVVAALILMPKLVELLFRLGDYWALTESFDSAQILGYIQAVLPLLGTIIFSWLVLKQNKQIHAENKKIQTRMNDLEAETLKNNYFNHMDIVDVNANNAWGINGIKVIEMNNTKCHKDFIDCFSGITDNITINLSSDKNIDIRTIWFENRSPKSNQMIMFPHGASETSLYNHYIPIHLWFFGQSAKEEIRIDELCLSNFRLMFGTGKNATTSANTAIMFDSYNQSCTHIVPTRYSDKTKCEYDYGFQVLLHIFSNYSEHPITHVDMNLELTYVVQMDNFIISTPKRHQLQIGRNIEYKAKPEKTSSLIGLDGKFLKITTDEKTNATELTAMLGTPKIDFAEER